MRPTKWTLGLILIATAVVAFAQQRDAASLNPDFPVPVWPSNGVIPADMKTHYVFVDPAKNEYVVAYPENLGSPNFEKDGPKDRQVSRFKMQRDVDPAVNVAISAATPGHYKYAYTVVDAPKAKQSIDQWVLVMPDAGATTTKQPAGWFGVVQKGRKFAVPNPDWIKSGSAVVFSYDKPAEQIQPGSIKGGFEVESDLKPGFTMGFFRQSESVEAGMQTSGNIPRVIIQNATPPPPTTTAGGPPAEGQGQRGFGGNQVPAGATAAWEPIKADVEKLLQVEYNSKALITIAPKFDKSVTDKAIAADYLQGLAALSKSGGLTADSPFVKGTITDLDAYVKAGATGPLKLSAQPKGDAETQILNAMKLSLHIS